ncbi:MarR family winged helix-turn-helix transcriptional regulator [Tsukamurella pseudospumae]|uniref:MarR family transcriptional regulator n=1 Tax=Tsukamurella pseudospumae TaxID=239498 RepID=A0A138A078_9ACTN|nr:MarR family transcriptional regulator [Tsukamurella pseudospumae]KXO89089.1 MarR family transcriptional regulator [Tsukamurella pseudospumae]KXP03799.1 MarR family transcriptional regulator [Tsukamurella pseudospumae]
MSEPTEGLGDVLSHITMLLGIVTREHGERGAPSYSRMRLLGTLEEIQPATQHELAQAMLVSDAAVSRMLTALVPEGLVTVEPDPAHARRRLVRLTDDGAELFHASSNDYAAQLKKALTERDFPYDRYLRDSIALRDFLAAAAGRG